MNANASIASPVDLVMRRKPRIMIAGEFSAGKSRLINGLLGTDLLPSNVTSTALPPIWMIGGGDAALVVGLDGSVSDLDFDEIDVESTAYCLLSCNAEILRHVDLIDTPGSSDPNIPSVCWERIVDYADSLIWCSSAMQAWKQTEKATVSELPDDLRAQATLLITQADRMPDQKSADKVLRRVTRDASKYLPHVLMGSMLSAEDVASVADRIRAIAGDLPLRGAPSEVVDAARGEGIAEPVLMPAPEQSDVSVKPDDALAHEEPALAMVSKPYFETSDADDEFEDAPAPDLDVKIVLNADHVHVNALEKGADAPETPVEGADTVETPEDCADVAEARDEPVVETAETFVTPLESEAADETNASDMDVPAEIEASEPSETVTFAPETDETVLQGDAPAGNTSFGLEDGTVAALWDRIAGDADLSDNERFLACVSSLLVEVQGLLKAQDNVTSSPARL